MTIFNRITILAFLLLTLSACDIAPETNAKESDITLDDSNFEQVITEKEIDMYEVFLEIDTVEKISLSDLKYLTENSTENELIYFGRSTCVYCRELIIKNGKRIKESNLKMFYVDTDLIPKNEKNNLDKYGIEVTPSFIQLTGNGNFKKVEITEFERMIEHEQ